jgi:acyl-CoA thioesterase-2
VSGLLDVLDLEQVEDDLYRGRPVRTTFPRTFGGQVACQSLVAATRTLREGMGVHSLHGYFLREGDPELPTVYRVDRLREGRSFATRQVSGVQNGRAIFSMSASFSLPDHGPEHQAQAPDVPAPEELQGGVPADPGLHQVLRTEWPDWDLHPVPWDGRGPAQQVWLRHRHPLGDDPVLHACALAYASDMTLLGCSRLPYRDRLLQMASLDHAVWFLRPFRADDWLLYDQTSPSAGGGRCLTQGRVFDRSGRLVANVVQEGLMRTVVG